MTNRELVLLGALGAVACGEGKINKSTEFLFAHAVKLGKVGVTNNSQLEFTGIL